MATPTADIGLIGLAVMGENLVLNIESRGYTAAVYNRTTSKVDDFVKGRGAGKKFVGCHSIQELCQSLKKPRRVIMMVKAGEVVDAFIDQLLPHLEAGDIIIDGGNSHFPDSNRRTVDLEKKNILFVGCGVSGGEEGALHGPSMMPGGSEAAWPHVKEIFQAICAKVEDGSACCEWVGPQGSGHYVKMVHNGIEYGDMQLIAEAYHLLKDVVGLTPAEMGDVFDQWNTGDLDSYLIEITRDILRKTDEKTGKPMVDVILDAAGQKGTGKWTATSALDFGQPVTLIGEAVFARCLSSLKEERVAASKILQGPAVTPAAGDKKQLIEDIRQALFAAKIVSYTQGFMLLRAAAAEYGWKLNYGTVARTAYLMPDGGIALMWRGGCIIRSTFLANIKAAYDKNPELQNLLLDDFFREKITTAQESWRRTVVCAVTHGVPVPAICTALNFYDGYRAERLPANLLQAQRDFFGAHTYERVDDARGSFHHTNWTGRGGTTASSTYSI